MSALALAAALAGALAFIDLLAWALTALLRLFGRVV